MAKATTHTHQFIHTDDDGQMYMVTITTHVVQLKGKDAEEAVEPSGALTAI